MIDGILLQFAGSSYNKDVETTTSVTHVDICRENILADLREELMRFFNQLLIVRPVDFASSEQIQPIRDMCITLSFISYEEALKLMSGPHQLRASELLNRASRVDAESAHSRELVDLHSLLGTDKGSGKKAGKP